MKMDEVIGQPISSLDTPCLILDKQLLVSNIQQMQQFVSNAGKNLRPHVKTHKCLDICQLQIEAGAIGISAAEVSEALVLAKNNFKNTLITSPVTTDLKIATLIACLLHDPDLIIVIDNLDNAAKINHAVKQQGLAISVLIDIDPGVGRTGIKYEDIITFAKALSTYSHLKLLGIQCYAGNLQHIANYVERQQASRRAMQKAAACLRQLNDEGFNCDLLSGSSTGTFSIDVEIPEMTEVQPGSYTVMDAEYQAIDFKNRQFLPALRLITTVISANHPTHVTCDAGWKSLYEVATRPY